MADVACEVRRSKAEFPIKIFPHACRRDAGRGVCDDCSKIVDHAYTYSFRPKGSRGKPKPRDLFMVMFAYIGGDSEEAFGDRILRWERTHLSSEQYEARYENRPYRGTDESFSILVFPSDMSADAILSQMTFGDFEAEWVRDHPSTSGV